MLEIANAPTSLEQICQKYRRVLDEFPNEVNALMAMAEVSLLRGLRLEAQLAYEAAAKQRDGSEAKASLASLYYGHGLISQSSEELLKIEQLPEARLEVSYLRSLIAKHSGIQEPDETPLSPEPEIVRRKLKLALQRSLMLRDLQELLQLTEAKGSSPLAYYRVEETKKRLEDLEEQQSYIEDYSRNHHDRIAEEARQNSLELERLESIRHLSGDAPQPAETDWNQEAEWQATPAEPFEATPVSTPEEPTEEFIRPSETDPVDTSYEPSLVVTPALQSELPPVMFGELGEDLQLEVVQEPEYIIDLEYDQVDINSIDEEIESLQSAEMDSIELHSREPERVDTPEPVSTPAYTATDWDDAATFANPVVAAVEHPVETPAYEHPTAEVPVAPEPVETVAVTPAVVVPVAPVTVIPAAVTPTPVVAIVETPPVAEVPVVVAPAVEVPVVEPQPVSTPTAERPDLRKSLAEPIAVLARTRGVTSIHVLTTDGIIIEQTGLEGLEAKRFSEFVVEGMTILNSFASRPSYWVTECTGGILVLQTLSEKHVLVTVGQTGANFGTLRYTMDKVKSQLCAILASNQ